MRLQTSEAARPLARALLASQRFVVVLGGWIFSRPCNLLQFVFCFVRVQILSGFFLNVCFCPALVQYSPDLLYFGLCCINGVAGVFGAHHEIHLAPSLLVFQSASAVCSVWCSCRVFSGLWESHWVSVFTDN